MKYILIIFNFLDYISNNYFNIFLLNIFIFFGKKQIQIYVYIYIYLNHIIIYISYHTI